MEKEKQIRQHFISLGYAISIKVGSKKKGSKGKHIIDWEDGFDAARLVMLCEYYFGHETEATGYGCCSVVLDNFNVAGHGITGICKKCGCTDNDACHDTDTGSCYWLKEDLCSACADRVEKQEYVAEKLSALAIKPPRDKGKREKSKLHTLLEK